MTAFKHRSEMLGEESNHILKDFHPELKPWPMKFIQWD
jgi:hypothetical protein